MVRGLRKEPVTSQAEFQNHNLSYILYFSLVKLTKFIPKPLISNRYSDMITSKGLLKGSLLSVCDVAAWAREVEHWASTEEK